MSPSSAGSAKRGAGNSAIVSPPRFAVDRVMRLTAGSAKLLAILTTVAVVWAAATFYLACRFRDVRKFLAGAFFVSWGTQVYFYFANVSVPLLGTDFVFTPQISAARSIPHFVFFVLCLYFGFFWQPKGPRS